jgi:glutathione peroxidase
MTLRQSFIKAVYPAIAAVSGWFGNTKNYRQNLAKAKPIQSIYDLSYASIANQTIPLHSFRGKKLLLVNTASDCGFTPQLADLQQLHEKYSGSLVVIGFPSNDFKEQEKGSDSEIETFCKVNYGVNFLMAKKSGVLPGSAQNSLFEWLTQSSKNGWNNEPPAWNFTKYLVDEQGVLVAVYGSTIPPLSKELTSKL